MIGYFDYTVILTYASLVSAVLGILICMDGQGHPFIGVFFLMISGLFDAFDGKVARTKKNRTISEQRYGIQIDSLADLVAFGVLPACIGNSMLRVLPSMPEINRAHADRMTTSPFVSIFYAIMSIYVLTALIRLAYFNVEEESRNENNEGQRVYYTGLPVTTAALIFPILLSLQYITPFDITPFYFIAMLIVSLLFIMPIKVKKPSTRGILIMVAIGAIDFITILWTYISKI
ncbi:MAG: CDP-alcohol phosphatidyltransferase family protein [Lachnospiraceae bacterium]|nr:CDP-alcohol phosphatidyltransferase family protein [Lachnospiraceae bacterium]